MTRATVAERARSFFSLPQQGSPEAERLHRKQRLAAAFRIFARRGFDQGLAGHITARDPELTDHFWVNPLGRHFGQIRASDLQLVNEHGEIVVGDQPINEAAFVIHAAIHKARPDVVAAAHTHSTTARPGRPSAGCSTRSPRIPAPSTATTRSMANSTAWCWRRRRAGASSRRWATGRR